MTKIKRLVGKLIEASWILYIILAILALVFLSIRGYLVSQYEVVKEIERQGYYNVQVIEVRRSPFHFECSRDAAAVFTFRAYFAYGRPLGAGVRQGDVVERVACSLWPFKKVLIGTP